ncbi:MAG: flagellar motor switch protein FliM [Bacillota bacterium]
MKEVLSQSEIDLLLSALSSGELTTEDIATTAQVKIKEYDFRRPNKFSQDHLRTLSFIHENFARMISNFLSAFLRTSVQVKVASVDQVTYEDFVVSLPTPTLLTVYTMHPLPGKAVMETNPAFTFPIIDLLFGGSGEMPRKLRELTEIEINVLRNLNARLLEHMNYAWSDIFSVSPKLEGTETNPQLTQIISPNETVAVLSLTTSVGKSQGLVNLCLPFLTLEPVISKLSARHWFSASENNKNADHSRQIETLLGAAGVCLTLIGGQTSLTVRDFLRLQVGDVVPLDNVIGNDLELEVEGKPKFKVQPGLLGQKIAVQVTAIK